MVASWFLIYPSTRHLPHPLCICQNHINEVNLQHSPTMTLNTDTKTKQESIYSARVVMYIRSHRYKCTKILNQASVSKATSGAPECVSMSEAGEDDLFGDLSSACSSQIWPWGAVNKQKQANSSKRRIRECRGPSIQPTFHMALREDTLHLFKIFKERINFLSTSADEAIWVAQLQTHHNHQMSHHRLSCKSTLPAAPVRQLQGMHSKNCFSDLSAPWF